MNADVAAIRSTLALHRFGALVFPVAFLGFLGFCAWTYAVGPDDILWLLLAGCLAGLVPSALNAVALWLGHGALRDPGRPDRLAAAMRIVTAAFWISCFGWMVPAVVGLLLEFGSGATVFLIGLMWALPLITVATSIHTSRKRLARARDALAATPLPAG
ncbi:hypothetical protein Val02_86120 [Virgisporangium aliadipatigenens]|uniref:Uncharacterized protein n=1 Tax=Virgisporangium aliadipatigenens TaxID=741659 RepID=A0A8J3YXX8_9ACTN|nr:hypothetical protein [Virgisporangium aliadipatigenens]GIJ51726.1 hypothetical protein Val02_86120 [Virgisporangium aliadipatigenens]